MTYSLPVIDEARSDARNATSSATSSGRGGRVPGFRLGGGVRAVRPSRSTRGKLSGVCALLRPLAIFATSHLQSVKNKFNCRNKGASMKTLMRGLRSSAAILVFAVAIYIPVQAQKRIEDRFASVNGVKLHYLIAGKAEPVLLLHGYAENSHMWRPLIPELAKTHTVIAPDLRGFGQSAKPNGGYTKKTMAQDIHALAMSLGFRHEVVEGHDIGLMVAYAYAEQYPNEVDRVVLMDAFLPGVGDWKSV